MNDSEKIRALCHKYAELVDLAEFAAVGQLLGQGSLTRVRPGVPDETSHGAEQIAAFYTDHVQLHAGAPGTRHLITNLTVDVSDDGSAAQASSYFTVLQCLPGFPLQIIATGRYADSFEKGADWHFTNKAVTADFVGDFSWHAKTQPLT